MKAFFELFEGELKGANSLGFHGRNIELIFPSRAVNGEVTPECDFQSVFRTESDGGGRRTKHHPADLGFFIFKGEVPVSGGSTVEIG